MDRQSLDYLQSKVHEAQRVLRTTEALGKAIQKIEECGFTTIKIFVGEGGGCVALDFQGNRNELKKVLEKWQSDLEDKFSNL
jgi:hypothetical protein